MTGNTELLLKALFDADNLNEISLERVKELVEKHPSFHPGHFFLAKKLQLEQDETFAKHTLRTALHFNNPFWLQWLLLEHSESTGETLEHPEVKNEFPFDQSMVADRTASFSDPEQALANQELHGIKSKEPGNEEQIPIPETTLTYNESEWDEPVREDQESTLEIDSWTEAHFRAGTDFPVTTPLTPPQEPDAEVPWPAFEAGNVEIAAEESEPVLTSEEGQLEPLDFADEMAGTELAALEKTVTWNEGHERPQGNENVAEENGMNDRGNVLSPDPGGMSAQDPMKGFGAPLPDQQEDALTFEPYFTIDYFASQGIRLPTEEVPTDRFSQQLKSFTDWLKTMKRLPITAVLPETSEAEESNLKSIADRSNEEKDIVTETMAEVLVKQGNLRKAVDIYQKLSLLNPSKSAYFAARIEDLKNLLT